MLDLLVDSMATWRLTRLVVEDKITEPIREQVAQAGPTLAYGIECPACVSVWAALAISTGLVPRKVRVALAMSAVVLAVKWADEQNQARHLRAM